MKTIRLPYPTKDLMDFLVFPRDFWFDVSRIPYTGFLEPNPHLSEVVLNSIYRISANGLRFPIFQFYVTEEHWDNYWTIEVDNLAVGEMLIILQQ